MALLCSINAPFFLEDLLIWCGGQIACCHRLLATSSSGCPLMACRNRALRWYGYAQTLKNEICHGTIIVSTGGIASCGAASGDKMPQWLWVFLLIGFKVLVWIFHRELFVYIFHENIFHHIDKINVYAAVLMKTGSFNWDLVTHICVPQWIKLSSLQVVACHMWSRLALL